MIYNFLNMDGYGLYVFSSFIFTLVSFAGLYLIIKSQLIKEQKKFKAKFGSLTADKVTAADFVEKQTDTYTHRHALWNNVTTGLRSRQ